MDKIYLLKNRKVLMGPFTIEKLIERTIRPTDMVWYDGLADWMEASKIPSLSPAITATKNPDETKTAKTFKQRLGKIFSS